MFKGDLWPVLECLRADNSSLQEERLFKHLCLIQKNEHYKPIHYILKHIVFDAEYQTGFKVKLLASIWAARVAPYHASPTGYKAAQVSHVCEAPVKDPSSKVAIFYFMLVRLINRLKLHLGTKYVLVSYSALQWRIDVWVY